MALGEGSYLGRPEPTKAELTTSSLGKYLPFIRAFGGWPLFQDLLACLRTVADRHQVAIANVAVRWVLDRPQVGGVIIGARLGIADHIEENKRYGQRHEGRKSHGATGLGRGMAQFTDERWAGVRRDHAGRWPCSWTTATAPTSMPSWPAPGHSRATAATSTATKAFPSPRDPSEALVHVLIERVLIESVGQGQRPVAVY